MHNHDPFFLFRVMSRGHSKSQPSGVWWAALLAPWNTCTDGIFFMGTSSLLTSWLNSLGLVTGTIFCISFFKKPFTLEETKTSELAGRKKEKSGHWMILYLWKENKKCVSGQTLKLIRVELETGTWLYQIKVNDGGLSKLLNASVRQEFYTTVKKGRPAYMPPEVLRVRDSIFNNQFQKQTMAIILYPKKDLSNI